MSSEITFQINPIPKHHSIMRITEHPKVPNRSGEISLDWEICHTAFVVKPPSRENQRRDLDLDENKAKIRSYF